MEPYYSIGDVHKATGLSIDTLRYYDKIGLLKPAYINESSGYRYYVWSQVWQIEMIRMCKQMDFSLEKMMELFDKQDNSVMMDFVRMQKQEAKEQIRKYRKIIEDLEWYESEWEKLEQATEDCYERTLGERTVVYVQGPVNRMNTHVELQSVVRKELDHTNTIRRKYGYLLNREAFLNEVYQMEGEYISLDKKTYHYVDKKNLLKLPAGRYFCMRKKLERDFRLDFTSVAEQLDKHHIIPRLIVAEELAMPWFEVDSLWLEIQILTENEKIGHDKKEA